MTGAGPSVTSDRLSAKDDRAPKRPAKVSSDWLLSSFFWALVLMPYPLIIGQMNWLVANVLLLFAFTARAVAAGALSGPTRWTIPWVPVAAFSVWAALMFLLSAASGRDGFEADLLRALQINNHLVTFVALFPVMRLVVLYMLHAIRVSKIQVTCLLLVYLGYQFVENGLLGATMEITLIHVLVAFGIAQHRWTVVEKLALILVLGVGILNSDRVSTDIYLAGLSIFLISQVPFARPRLIFCAIVCYAALFVLFMLNLDLDRISEIYRQDYNTFIRIQMLRSAIVLFTDVWDVLVGIGFNEPYRIASFDIWSDHPLTATEQVYTTPNHNSHFDLLLRLGLVGYLLFFAPMVLNTMRSGWALQGFLLLIFVVEISVNPWLEDSRQMFLVSFIFCLLQCRRTAGPRRAT